MNKNSIIVLARNTLITAVLISSISCQRASIPRQSNNYQSYITKPSSIVVKGQFFASRFDSTSAMRGYKLVFSRQLVDRSVERISADRLSNDGFYRIRVQVDRTYQIAVMIGDCRIETQEYYASSKTKDSVQVKNFYLNPPDSTAYGGCMAGWRPQLINH